MSARKSLALGFGLMALANILGGATYPVQKLALDGLPPATVTLLRNLFALVPLALLTMRPAAKRKFAQRMHTAGRSDGTSAGRGMGFLGLRFFEGGDLGRMLVLGILAYGAPLLLGIVGTKYSTASNASILLLVEPPMILFFSWLLLKERIRPRVMVGICVGLIGAAWIVLDSAAPGDLFAGELMMGNLLLAFHGALWGLHTPISKPLAMRVDPFVLTTWVVLSSMLILIPGAAYELMSFEFVGPIGPALWWTVALGLVGTVLSLGFWFFALERIPASSVAPFLFLQPLVGVLIGVLWLDEPMTGAIMIGGTILVVGVLFTLGGQRTRGSTP
ncbi:MAG: drug/metabolite transporter (DMT)-like permease [Planctomycetota bacterium]|jgi:drug/metabolite transporter (DMT)-like permease